MVARSSSILLLGKLLRGDHIRETSQGLRRATPPRSRSLPVCIRFLCNDSAVGCGIEWRVESTIYCLVEPGPDSAKESALEVKAVLFRVRKFVWLGYRREAMPATRSAAGGFIDWISNEGTTSNRAFPSLSLSVFLVFDTVTPLSFHTLYWSYSLEGEAP